MKASFTYNTDFSQTEVDNRQINLTRFSLRFPEQRDFFLEGSSILQFAPSSGVDPYFSRRIGLVNGMRIPLKYGGRIIGNVGKNNIALLHVRTGKTGELNPESVSVVNWFVVMGIGQMVVLELPASKLSDVNLAIERTAWKAFKSEFYPTYDLYPIKEKKLKNKSKVNY